MNYDSMKKIFFVFFSMNILFYEYVVYEFLLFYDFFPSMKSRSVADSSISYGNKTWEITEKKNLLLFITLNNPFSKTLE